MLTENDQVFMKRFTDEFMIPMMQEMAQGEMTPERYRKAMAGLEPWKNETSVAQPDVDYHPEVEIHSDLKAAIALPKDKGPFPIFVVAHGNGLAAGSAHLYRRLTKDIAAGGFLAITPDFRLAPEHPFPAAYDDMIATLRWARDHASEYRGNSERMVLFGDSLGAALGMGVVLGLQNEPDTPAVRAFVGAEGFYDFSTPAMALNPVILWYASAETLTDKRISPLLGIKPGMQLPSIFLISGTADMALLPTLDFARKLNECGIHFELHVLEGMPHDFMKFPELDGMREGHRLMFDFLARSL